jgi:hypothetical protein
MSDVAVTVTLASEYVIDQVENGYEYENIVWIAEEALDKAYSKIVQEGGAGD